MLNADRTVADYSNLMGTEVATVCGERPSEPHYIVAAALRSTFGVGLNEGETKVGASEYGQSCWTVAAQVRRIFAKLGIDAEFPISHPKFVNTCIVKFLR